MPCVPPPGMIRTISSCAERGTWFLNSNAMCPCRSTLRADSTTGTSISANGFVYVAHTAIGTVEVVDGLKGTLQKTIPGCPEGSGVVCAQADGLVFAASRGTGKVLVIHAAKGTVSKTIQVGSRPNGVAWDDDHGVLLVADVADLHARLVDPERGEVLKASRLPGRPRWCSTQTTWTDS